MTVHLCVRVYASGGAKESLRDAEGLESWISFNRKARPGNALFVDGTCAETDRGYLSRAHVAEIEALLVSEMSGRSGEGPVRKSGGRYPDDRQRNGFLLRDDRPVEPRKRTCLLEESWHVPDDAVAMVPSFIPAG